MKLVKTFTLLDNDSIPVVSILEGHHDIDTFNLAFKNEGWISDPWPEDWISHEYWINHGMGRWSCSNRSDPKAIPVTVAGWDDSVWGAEKKPNRNLH